MARRKYENPPIKEVICEFRFSQTSLWDPTIPGLVFEKLRDKFPIREQGKNVKTELIMDGEQVQPQFQVTLSEHAVFKNEQQNIIIQVGSHYLAINHVVPYSSWENFMDTISQALTTYIEIAEPNSIDRIELRNINEINLGSELSNLENYFNFYPSVGNATYNSFIVGIQMEFEDDVQKIQMTNNDSVIMIDTLYFLGKPKTVNFKQIHDWLEKAHSQNNEAFENSIKQNLRDTFKEVDNT